MAPWLLNHPEGTQPGSPWSLSSPPGGMASESKELLEDSLDDMQSGEFANLRVDAEDLAENLGEWCRVPALSARRVGGSYAPPSR